MIKVCIVDDHKVLIDGLQSMLTNQADIDVVGSCQDGVQLLHFLQDNEVDVILLDINMPNMNGIDACKEVVKKFPKSQILVLSMLDQSTIVQRMMKRGAKGYVLKNVGKAELVEAIQTVHAGQMYLSKSIQQSLLQFGQQEKTGYLPVLTRREKEVLELIAQEKTTNEISEELFISVNTVDTHRKSLLSKFGARNSIGLVKAAMEKGLLD